MATIRCNIDFIDINTLKIVGYCEGLRFETTTIDIPTALQIIQVRRLLIQSRRNLPRSPNEEEDGPAYDRTIGLVVDDSTGKVTGITNDDQEE
jgi:hypothetical protein